MRRFRLWALPLMMALSACSAGDVSSTESDEQLITGATFVTMDGDASPEAMLISEGRIIALGTEAALSTMRPNAETLDYSGRTILPGFIDSHVHIRELGLDAIKVDLVGVETVEDIVRRIQDQRPNLNPGEWVIGQGWDEGAFASYDGSDAVGGYPTTRAISAAFPDNPVALESLHGFGAMANAKALEIVGIDDDTPNPEGGTILRDETGAATGVLLTLAQALLFEKVPAPDDAQIEAAIIAGLNRMAEAGVTSVHEAGMTARDVRAFQAIAGQGRLPIRVVGLLNGNDTDLMNHWFERGIEDDPKDWLDIRGIKVFFDGSLGSRTAILHAPYSDRPDAAHPTARISFGDMDQLGVRANERGFQMAVHAIGDAANHIVLTQFERNLLSSDTMPDHRWRIEHAQVVDETFAERAADLQVIASMQPSHAMGDSPWAEARVGPNRIKRAYSWKTFQDAGVPIIFNSDLPGEPWEPMETLHFAMTRTKLDGTPEGGWYFNEALDREASLRAMTIDGAHAAFQDASLGSLATGKWADFVVLSGNPLTAPDVRDIKVEATFVAGKRVGN
ncbi:MAG: amidohydrolase [Pseudomonadota bacterium]